jgi:hypothetical protein
LVNHDEMILSNEWNKVTQWLDLNWKLEIPF